MFRACMKLVRNHINKLVWLFQRAVTGWSLIFSLSTGIFSAIPVPGDGKNSHILHWLSAWYMGNILWTAIAGVIISIIYIGLSCIRRRMETRGKHAPCIQSIAAAARANMIRMGLVDDCRVVIYRVKNEDLLEPFWVTPPQGLAVASVSVNRDDPAKNIGPVAQCWFKNLDMRQDRASRFCDGVCRSKGDPHTKAIVVAPVIVSAQDACPWGIVYIAIPRRLESSDVHKLTEVLNMEWGLVHQLEDLLEKQRSQGHFLRFARA